MHGPDSIDPVLFLAAADAVVVLHAAFVAFVALGGLFVIRRPRAAWVHAPAAVWGVLVEFGGWICPLTPLENALRQRAGAATYQGDFIGHQLLPLLYPAHLTRGGQVALGAAALALNVLLYWKVFRPRARLGHASRSLRRKS